MKRLFIIFILCAAFGFSVQAGDYDYLAFRSNDGTEISLSVSNLKITFSNGQLVAVNSETNQTFSLSDLNKMYFTNSAITNIEEVLPTDLDTEVEIFTTSGVSKGRYNNLNQARQTLSKGVYIVKQSEKTYKIAVK